MNEKIAVLGPQGTFTEKAAKSIDESASLIYMNDVEDVFKFVTGGMGDGVIAIENSLEGSVLNNLMLLKDNKVYITDEITLDISLCLMSGQNTSMDEITTIMSHSHALAQCRKYLKQYFEKRQLISTASTAEAMKKASEKQGIGAIGFGEFASTYHLKIIENDIQDKQSQTRFLRISKDLGGGPKSSIIFAGKDKPGLLYEILKIFALQNINLTKIESRPSRQRLGEYVFYLDFLDERISDDEREEILNEVKKNSTFFKYLGSY